MKTILIAENIGTFALEDDSKLTFIQALKEHGLKSREWKLIDTHETKKTITYTVVPKNPVTVEPASVPAEAPDEQQEAAPPENNLPATTEDSYVITDALTGVVVSGEIAPKTVIPPGRIRVDRAALTECLNVCCKITNSASIMPILSTVRIKTTNPDAIIKPVRISATDLEISYEKTLPGEGDPIDICVHARLLLAEIKALPKDVSTVDLNYDDMKLSVNGRCTLFCSDPEEFPEIIPIDPASVMTIGNLIDALKTVAPAVSKDQTRYVLTGALIDPVKNKVAATDGFRLHTDDITSRLHTVDDIPSDHPAPSIIVPLRTVQLLIQYSAEEQIIVNEAGDKAVFAICGGQLITRLILGTFPDLENVTPDNPIRYTFVNSQLRNLIEGAIPLADDCGIVLTFNDDTLEMTAEGGKGHYKWDMPCQTQKNNGDAVSFSFAPQFLVDVLKSYPAEVTTLEMPEIYGACLFNKKAIIMPRRM
jgi:DNA polymerase III sliding clamp (beta) subunit (PCNA family)